MPCCMLATPDRIHLGDMARDGVEDATAALTRLNGAASP